MGRQRRLVISGFALCVAAFLEACTPVNIQSFAAASSLSGNPAYSVTGYTSAGEIDPADARPYVQEFGDSVCPEGSTIQRVDTLPTRGGYVLYWQAIVECNGPGKGPKADTPVSVAEKPKASSQDQPATSPKAKCLGWLESHYKSYTLTAEIDEYEAGGVYTYKGNFEVVPDTAPETEIGFECVYVKDRDKLIGLPDLKPFPVPTKPAVVQPGSQLSRVRFGYSACPTLEPWKRLVDEVAGKNYSAELPHTCVFLRDGEKIYLPPTDRATYKDAKYVKIGLSDGRAMWIEAVNIQ